MKCYKRLTDARYLQKLLLSYQEVRYRHNKTKFLEHTLVLLSTYQASKICFPKVGIFIVIKYMASSYAPSFTNYEVYNDADLTLCSRMGKHCPRDLNTLTAERENTVPGI
jgi:hypothetical protein